MHSPTFRYRQAFAGEYLLYSGANPTRPKRKHAFPIFGIRSSTGLRSIHDIAEYSELAVPEQCDRFQEGYRDWMLDLSAF